MSFSEAVQSVLNQYMQFNGRARRSEFWYFALFQAVVLLVASVFNFVHPILGGLLLGLAGLALLLPSLGVSIRRLHDTSRSGWWFLLSFVPFGGLVLLVFYCIDGTPGPNRFGEDPKRSVAAVVPA
jgi:uncharacterized membrane protein YhaH (DUF805 family)